MSWRSSSWSSQQQGSRQAQSNRRRSGKGWRKATKAGNFGALMLAVAPSRSRSSLLILPSLPLSCLSDGLQLVRAEKWNPSPGPIAADAAFIKISDLWACPGSLEDLPGVRKGKAVALLETVRMRRCRAAASFVVTSAVVLFIGVVEPQDTCGATVCFLCVWLQVQEDGKVGEGRWAATLVAPPATVRRRARRCTSRRTCRDVARNWTSQRNVRCYVPVSMLHARYF